MISAEEMLFLMDDQHTPLRDKLSGLQTKEINSGGDFGAGVAAAIPTALVNSGRQAAGGERANLLAELIINRQ